MTAILNDLRQNATDPGLPNLATPVTSAAAADLLFSERAFWLYATGHRLGDMRRLIRQYARQAGYRVPHGGLPQGRQRYGEDVNLPLPIDEENNPNGGSCLDRNA